MKKTKSADLPDCLFEHSGIPDHDHEKAVQEASKKPWPDAEAVFELIDQGMHEASEAIKAFVSGDYETVERLETMPVNWVVLAALQHGAALQAQSPDSPAKVLSDYKKAKAKHAADAKHSAPGKSRDKRQQMRDIWATGKYTTRDRCAEEECAALGVSFRRARGYLTGTPAPKRPDDA